MNVSLVLWVPPKSRFFPNFEKFFQSSANFFNIRKLLSCPDVHPQHPRNVSTQDAWTSPKFGKLLSCSVNDTQRLREFLHNSIKCVQVSWNRKNSFGLIQGIMGGIESSMFSECAFQKSKFRIVKTLSTEVCNKPRRRRPIVLFYHYWENMKHSVVIQL